MRYFLPIFSENNAKRLLLIGGKYISSLICSNSSPAWLARSIRSLLEKKYPLKNGSFFRKDLAIFFISPHILFLLHTPSRRTPSGASTLFNSRIALSLPETNSITFKQIISLKKFERKGREERSAARKFTLLP